MEDRVALARRVERLARKLVENHKHADEEISADEAQEADALIAALSLAERADESISDEELGAARRMLADTPAYSGKHLEKTRFLGGTDGAFELHLKDGDGIAGLAVLKRSEGSAERFGASIARSAGVIAPRIYVDTEGSGLSLIEHISDLEGREASCPFRAELGRMLEVRMLPDALENNSTREAIGLDGPEGRGRMFLAWAAYQELSRLALLGDRRIDNTALATTDRGDFVMIALDTDAVGYGVRLEGDAEGRFSSYERQHAMHSVVLMRKLASANATDGIGAGFGRLRDDMMSAHARIHLDAEGYRSISGRICGCIMEEAGKRTRYGISAKVWEEDGRAGGSRQERRTILDQASASSLCGAIMEGACAKARASFLRTQEEMFAILDRES